MKSFCKLLCTYLIVIFFHSCSTSSAASEEISSEVIGESYEYLPPDAVVYATTIEGLISTFPKSKNDGINAEIKNLKLSLTDYLKATRTYNQRLKVESINSFVKSYKRIQKLRRFLSKDDDDILNRYLVKLKTTINLLESAQKSAFVN